jgi:hypothetical protein
MTATFRNSGYGLRSWYLVVVLPLRLVLGRSP